MSRGRVMLARPLAVALVLAIVLPVLTICCAARAAWWVFVGNSDLDPR